MRLVEREPLLKVGENIWGSFDIRNIRYQEFMSLIPEDKKDSGFGLYVTMRVASPTISSAEGDSADLLEIISVSNSY